MTTNDLQKAVKAIVDEGGDFGLKAFVCLNGENGIYLRKMLIDDGLNSDIRTMLKGLMVQKYLCDDLEVDSSNNIIDNRNVLYEIVQTDQYYPFKFEAVWGGVTECYEDADVDNVLGLAFRLNLNQKAVWVYQQVSYPQLIKKSRHLYAILSRNEIYTKLNRSILKVEEKIDILVVGNSIFTSKINLLQKFFGFEEFVRNEASKTIEMISSMGLVDGVDVFLKFENKKALTNAKKLVKAKSSPVFRMKKEDLITRLQELPRYKDTIEISGEQIVVKTQKAVSIFLEMLNDNIVRSELTQAEYISPVKTELDPLG